MMRTRLSLLACGVLIVAFVFTPGATAVIDEETRCGNVDNVSQYRSLDGREYIIQKIYFNKSGSRVCSTFENKGEMESSISFEVVVDGYSSSDRIVSIKPGQSITYNKNISEFLNVNMDNHLVEVGALGTNPTYHFTRELNASDPGGVPSPYISDVDVLRYEQNDSAALNVSVTNPAARPYGLYIQASTYGTQRVYNTRAPQPNETVHVRLPLKETVSESVAGQVSIFDDWASSEGKFDQKEFVSRPDREIRYWDDHFEKVPWANRSTRYQNESMQKYVGPDTNPISQTKSRIGAVLVVALVACGIAWRRRRKYR